MRRVDIKRNLVYVASLITINQVGFYPFYCSILAEQTQQR